ADCQLVFLFFFFFFQAEDGIRDLIVTGVQTCALPISADCQRLRLRYQRKRYLRCYSPGQGLAWQRCRYTVGHWSESEQFWRDQRSEERRVGKEGQGRGWQRC